MDTISLLSLIIGLVSFASSIVFYMSARNAEQPNRRILDDINKAIKKWQSKIMDYAIEMIKFRPEIIAKRSHAENSKAKNELLHSLLLKNKIYNRTTI